jgi:hypothetical protein
VPAVDVGHASCAKSTCVTAAKAGDVISGKAADAADVAATKAADVGTAHAPHTANVATTKAAAEAAAMATTATAAASGLCARGKQASGKQCACKNHHRSSFHDILHSDGRIFRHVALSDIGGSQRSERRRRDRLEM